MLWWLYKLAEDQKCVYCDTAGVGSEPPVFFVDYMGRRVLFG